MDAFADLAWTSSTTNSAKNATLGSQQKSQSSLGPSTSSSSSDLFGRLAAAQPAGNTASIAQPRPIGASGPGSSSIGTGVARPPARVNSGGSNGDPFSGLFARGGSPNINMSMADRRAHAEREKREREKREKERLEAQGAMWDQLDGQLSTNIPGANSRTVSPSPAIFNGPSSTSSMPHGAASPPSGLKTNPGVKRATSPPNGGDLFWSMHRPPQNNTSRTTSPLRASPALRQPTPTIDTLLSSKSTPSPSTQSVQSAVNHDAWSQLDALVSPKPAFPPTSRPTAGLDPFDLDTLVDAPTAQSSASVHQPTPPRSRARTPGEFDFGDREDANSAVPSDDDILGDLAKPVSDLRIDSPTRPSPSSTRKTPKRAGSPPPHVIGKIVEMGFTPEQARLALAATDTGIDVEAALESLLAMGGDVTSPTSFRDDSRELPTSRARPRTGDATPPRTIGTATPPTNGITSQLQTDKLLSQASELGFSMFTRANAFWNQGKEAVQKAYEEGIKATGTPSTGGDGRTRNINDGRPKWMTTDTPDFNDEPSPTKTRAAPVEKFADDTDAVTSSFDDRPQRRTPPAGTAAAPPSQAKKSLFDDDAPSYVSPHRRRAAPAPSSSRHEPPAASNPAARQPLPAARQAPPQRTAPSRPKITVPQTSPAAIASTISARTKGTELFKLGQYADAEAAYTSGITSLPPTHVLLTSLYTNRAAARLKTGDMSGAVGDCTAVFKLIGLGEENVSGLLELDETSSQFRFDGVPGKLDLREQVVKALQRRAAGLEGMERWEKARADWERLAGLGWAHVQGKVRDEAVRSAARCRGIVNAAANPASASVSAPPKPRPRPAPRPSAQSKPSEAAQRLKQAEAAQEAEANEAIQLKDSVDARIQAWKGGKEANVRALIASLDLVLWPELGWVKVGMHELVTPSQVKIRYTKAIAKVHPDKLKAGNTTVEQRMLANAVFAGLNEAWGAFKQ